MKLIIERTFSIVNIDLPPITHPSVKRGRSGMGHDAPPRYQVAIRYGKRYEPWVVDVQPLE